MIRVSIVIATYNRGEKLLRTLGSLAAQTLPAAEWEAVVVNNNSSDNTGEVFERFASQHPELRLRMVGESRQGLSWARNKGIEEARGAVIALIDDDVEINPEFAEVYAAFFDRHPAVSAAGGKVIPLYETARPEWMSPFAERPIAGTLDRGEVEKPLGRGYPTGANMAMRAEIFKKYGAFNTELGRTGANPLGGEEKDFFARITSAGEVVWWVPRAVIFHIIPPEKLTADYFRRVSRGCGASERVRTRSLSRGQYLVAVGKEMLKWVATLAIALWYCILLQPQKAHYLIEMRRFITAGLLSRH
ncbi:MAG: glycosyltransferase [Rikenellaceae bacterium]|jgi:glycosyltransferase involved in cell wall biosynthesis|nr:glycosyltransferase [Rikenellaceae bacterium]